MNCIKRISKLGFCLMLSFMIALAPLGVHVSISSTGFSFTDRVNLQKNEAQALAPALPAAGAALAALAAELGISEAALTAGLAAVAVGATGLYIYGNSWDDLDNPPAPGWPAWNDLPPAVQDGYDYNDNPRAKNYYDNAVAWWALQYGVIGEGPGGDLEPTPEPENNPESWQKARNVLVALGTGVGGVALYDALSPLVDNASAAVKELLFGTGTNDLSIPFVYSAVIAGKAVPFTSWQGITITNTDATYTITSGDWFVQSWYGTAKNRAMYEFFGDNTGAYSPTSSTIVNYYAGTNNWIYKSTDNPPVSSIHGYSPYLDAITGGGGGTLGDGGSYTWNAIANINFAGHYRFYDNKYFDNLLAEYYQGEWIKSPTSVDAQYGQMTDTPNELSQSIFNENSYYNFISNYGTDGLSDGQQRAIYIPDWMLDGTGKTEPLYEDFVKVRPDADVVPIPSDRPIDGTNPNPNPNPEFTEGFGKQVMRLLAQPFDQLFPFCLIGDLRRLTEMLHTAVYPSNSGGLSTQDVTIINGTEKFTIPFDGFGLENIDFELDLTPINSLAVMIRPFLTALFITGLLIGTFRFFLTRGGE